MLYWSFGIGVDMVVLGVRCIFVLGVLLKLSLSVVIWEDSVCFIVLCCRFLSSNVGDVIEKWYFGGLVVGISSCSRGRFVVVSRVGGLWFFVGVRWL